MNQSGSEQHGSPPHVSPVFPMDSGMPCRLNFCSLCCFDTEMPLTEDDVNALSEFYKNGAPQTPSAAELLSSAKALWRMEEEITNYRFAENVGWLDRYVLK